MKAFTTKKTTKTGSKIQGTIIATPKEGTKPKSLIKVVKGSCSAGNKEKVIEVIANYFNNTPFVPTSGYKDKQSTDIIELLSRTFPNVTWHKNSSQNPFDGYSVEARVTFESKIKLVSSTKCGYGVAKNVPGNASIYPTKAKVTDVVPKKEWKLYTPEQLEGYMDVIVLFVDTARDTNTLVRYAIVDGSYWNVDYKTYKGCSELFGLMNDPNVAQTFLDVLRVAAPDNKFVKRLINKNDMTGINLALRKLIHVANPTYEVANG